MTARAKRALLAVALPFLLFLLACAAVLGAGELLSAPARRSVGEPPPELFATAVRIPVGASYVSGWVARGAGSGAVLLLHGVRSDRRQMVKRALWLNQSGYSVLLIDLAAHGESPGERITFGAREADGVRAALQWLRRQLPGERVGVIGVSLGGASTLLAGPGKLLDALVIESVYPTIEDAVENRLAIRLGTAGRWMAPVLLKQIPLRSGVAVTALRPIEALAAMAAPVLVIGGDLDQHTSADETRRMHAAAPGRASLWMVPGAGHIDFHAHARDAYEQRVGSFLATHLRRARSHGRLEPRWSIQQSNANM